MIRRDFLKRMAFAALACGMLGTELLSRRETAWAIDARDLTEMLHRIYVEEVLPALREASTVGELFVPRETLDLRNNRNANIIRLKHPPEREVGVAR